jgi:phosphatidylglycerol:prolipoprotein diacylglycerol transferase
MFVFSCLAGIFLCVNAAKKEGINTQKVLNTLLIAFLGGITGARLYYVFQHFRFFTAHPAEIFTMWKGGFASLGAMAGGSIGAILYLRIEKIAVLKFADCCVLAIASGVFFTRIGCFLNGCCFGKISALPWAVRFPKESQPYIYQLYTNKITPIENLSIPVHPVQLYNSLAGIILFFLFLYISRYKKADGQLITGFLAAYFISIFFTDYFRENIYNKTILCFSQSQFISLFLAIIFIISLLIISKRKRGKNNTLKHSEN